MNNYLYDTNTINKTLPIQEFIKYLGNKLIRFSIQE